MANPKDFAKIVISETPGIDAETRRHAVSAVIDGVAMILVTVDEDGMAEFACLGNTPIVISLWGHLIQRMEQTLSTAADYIEEQRDRPTDLRTDQQAGEIPKDYDPDFPFD